MEGINAPPLTRILSRLARDWAICKRRNEVASDSFPTENSTGTRVEAADYEARILDEAFHLHPFPGLVRFVCIETGFKQEKLRAAALNEFDGEREVVVELNALDSRGRTIEWFEKLRTECPELTSRLFSAAVNGKRSGDTEISGPETILDRASRVFGLIRTLATDFKQDFESQGPVHLAGEPSPRQRHAEKIDEFTSAVLDVRDAIQNPPEGSAAVVVQLLKAGKYARLLPEVTDGVLLGLWPDLNSVWKDGYESVKEARNAARLDDPLAFLDSPPNLPVEPATPNTEIEICLIDRLLAGPDDEELKPRELALLEAYLNQAVDFAAVQRERRAHPRDESETWNRLTKLKLIRDFNRNLNSSADQQVTQSFGTFSLWAAAARNGDSLKSSWGDGGQPVAPIGPTELPQQVPTATKQHLPSTKKQKRSTERGEGRLKLIAALATHHKYADGGCLNLTPIGNNELARLADVSESTASEFFNREFNGGKKGGLAKYRIICSDAAKLVAALKLLNQEYSPHHLFGATPPSEDERDNEE